MWLFNVNRSSGIIAQKIMSLLTWSSVGSSGLNGAPTQLKNQNCSGTCSIHHTSTISIWISPVCAGCIFNSIRYTIAIKVIGNKSSLGSFSGLVPSKYSSLSPTPPLSVSIWSHPVTHISLEPFVIPKNQGYNQWSFRSNCLVHLRQSLKDSNTDH